MLKTLGFLLIPLLVLGLSLGPPPALAKSATTPRSIETTGTASISADPDRARIVVAVSSKAETAKGAAEATAEES